MQGAEAGAREQSHPFEVAKFELRAGGEGLGGGAKGNQGTVPNRVNQVLSQAERFSALDGTIE